MSFREILNNICKETVESGSGSISPIVLGEMTIGYLAALIWLEPGEGDNEFLDDTHEIYNISEEAIQKSVKDCYDFYNVAVPLLNYLKIDNNMIGHDFYLTRNEHGVGFWDRGYGDMGNKLTDLCKEAGKISGYVGDDGLIYIM